MMAFGAKALDGRIKRPVHVNGMVGVCRAGGLLCLVLCRMGSLEDILMYTIGNRELKIAPLVQ